MCIYFILVRYYRIFYTFILYSACKRDNSFFPLTDNIDFTSNYIKTPYAILTQDKTIPVIHAIKLVIYVPVRMPFY